MIKIKSTDVYHQYDKEGRAITTWDHKKCSWIINSEFEDEEIDFWGKDNDFPAACKLADYIEENTNWEKLPNITVTWIWNTKDALMLSCGRPTSTSEWEWYNKAKFPFTDSRSWGYLNYTKEEAIEHLGCYCDFYKGADNTKITYDDEILFDGKLKKVKKDLVDSK